MDKKVSESKCESVYLVLSQHINGTEAAGCSAAFCCNG